MDEFDDVKLVACTVLSLSLLDDLLYLTCLLFNTSWQWDLKRSVACRLQAELPSRLCTTTNKLHHCFSKDS